MTSNTWLFVGGVCLTFTLLAIVATTDLVVRKKAFIPSNIGNFGTYHKHRGVQIGDKNSRPVFLVASEKAQDQR